MIKINNNLLLESYTVAEKTMKEKATSFYQAFKLLPEDKFMGVSAIYAFCRYADDAVDNDNSRERKINNLEILKERLNLLYADNEDKDLIYLDMPWWIAFKDTINNYKIPIDGFLNQIKGQRWDIDLDKIRSIDELVEYSRLVAGSVGVMLAPILACDNKYTFDKWFIKSCENLGVGMQITNILRDIGEDYITRKKIYIPEELFLKYDLDPSFFNELLVHKNDENFKNQISNNFIMLWEELADLAEVYYKDYFEWISCFHPTARLPLVAAALSYKGILDAVRKENYNCFTKRCYTTLATRTKIIGQAREIVDRIALRKLV